MTPRRCASTLCVCFLVLVGLPSIAMAQPARVTVTPTSLTLTRQDASGAIAFTNSGSEAAAFQVTVQAWQGTDGSVLRLEPSTDLVVAPNVFHLEPGQSRRIRVLAQTMADRVEKTYRISVVQLPRDASGAPGVAMLMHLSLPIFVTPARALPRLDAAMASLQHDRLRVQLRNRGTATLGPRRVSVRLLDAARGEVGRQTFETWYLLPGEQRDVELPIDPASCGRVAAIEVDPGASLAQSTVALTAGAGVTCGP